MKIVTPPLVIEENDSFQNDLFDRKSFGESLLNIVERSDDALVISLDGKWGEGKTTFVKMWQGLLNESSFPNIYIDAFANDYIDDAFISVASAITEFADKNIKSNKALEFKEATKNIGGKLLVWSAKIAVKAATLGAIKGAELDELNDIKDDLSKSTSNLISDFIGERLNSHAEDVELLTTFKEMLSDLPFQLENDNEKPLVIIIDELDRCKPTYAVEIIEKIKHLFSVENIVFLLVMNKKQLEEAVKSVYGNKMDAHEYLQKFISIETRIPKKLGDRHSNDLSKYCRRLVELHELETWGDDRIIVSCIEPFANHFNLSLRQLEKAFTNIAILYSSSSENSLRLVPIITFISVIKVINTSLFEKLLYGNITYSQLCNEIDISPDINPDESDNHSRLWRMMMWVKYCLLSNQEFNELGEDDEIKDYGKSLIRYSIDRQRIIPIFTEKLSMFKVN